MLESRHHIYGLTSQFSDPVCLQTIGSLAEALCVVAKKDAKVDLRDGELPKSCLMFHKVQDSFVQGWATIVQRELTPKENFSFEFGPYYIVEKKDESRWLVDELIKRSQQLKDESGNAVKSHIRNWMSILHNYNEDFAAQKLNRLKAVHSTPHLKTLIEDIETI